VINRVFNTAVTDSAGVSHEFTTLYGGNFGELDASLFYNITSYITLGVQALNLTDALYRTLEQQHVGTSTFEWYGSGRTYSVQLRATL
jgi:iron complex outermembrane recepter protein